MTKPLISFIIPVYKVEPYLRQCLDSIIKQDFENYEVLMVDDGSLDNSPAICDEYAAIDRRFRVFHKENGGVSSARNLGLERAKGDWIWFVDADDYITDAALQIIAEATKLSCDTIFHGLVILYEDGRAHVKKTTECMGIGKDKFLERHFCYQNGMMLFSRDIITKAHLRFTEGIKMGEDLEFQYKYLLLCSHPISIPHDLYVYRQREGSATANPMTHVNNMNNCLTIAANLAEFVRKFNLPVVGWFNYRIQRLIKSGIQSAERLSWQQVSDIQDRLRVVVNAFRTAGYTRVADRTINLALFDLHLYVWILKVFYKVKGIKRQ